MKKLLFVLFISLFVLFGCNDDEVNSSSNLEESNDSQLSTDIQEDDSEKQTIDEEVEEVKEPTIQEVLEQEGYIVEELQVFPIQKLEVKIGDWRPDVVQYVMDNSISYEFICDPDNLCDYMEIEDTLIQFDDNLKVFGIYHIKDQNGQILNPKSVDTLIDIANEEGRIAGIKQREEAEKLHKEMEEEKKIRIGMTDDEVLKRWGEPKDINKTITEHRIYEQWVYLNYQYLYFEDGILTTIQQ